MFSPSNGSPTRSSAQKREREPTGSSGPRNGDGAPVDSEDGAILWRTPGTLPVAPSSGVAKDDSSLPGFNQDAFPTDLFARSGESGAVKLGAAVPPRPYTAFPLPTASLFSHGQGSSPATGTGLPLRDDKAEEAATPSLAQAGPRDAQEKVESDGSRASSCSEAPASEAPASTSSSSPPHSPATSQPEEEDDDEEEEEDDDSDTNEASERGMREDRLKRYPRFTSEYAAKCKGALVPFLRELLVPMPSPVSLHHDPTSGAPRPLPQSPPRFATRFVLYGKYVYQRTLGKGTYSKVVLGEELDHSPAVQQMQLVTGSSGGNAPLPLNNHAQPSPRGMGGPQVALKIFRDSDVYREACWDEYNILSALCTPLHRMDAASGAVAPTGGAVPNMLTTVRTAPSHTGVMDYYGNMGRFMTPVDYIPHPLHPAVVYPVMGPSLLHVVRAIKKASRDLSAATKRGASGSPTGLGDAYGSGTSLGSPSDSREIHGHGKNRLWLRGLPFPLFKVALYQILLFLKFTHARGLVHTDLKPENILFETNMSLPTPVNIFYKCLERHGNGRAAGPASSLEAQKIRNDVHKLTSASSKVNEMKGAFPGSPAEGEIAWKAPPTMPQGLAARDGSGGGHNLGPALHHAHFVNVPLPLLNSIRVVDLGAAQFVSSFTHKSHIDGRTPVSYDPIQTSHYRCPETVMGTGWSASADIFSIGCMIPELLTGDCLFMPQDTQEHLALMQHIIGPFWAPADPARPSAPRTIERVFTINARTFRHYFDEETCELKWPVTEEMRLACAFRQAGNEENGIDDEEDDQEPPLDPFKVSTEEDKAFVFDKPTLQEILGDQPLLLDLCRRMLRYNPLERITAEEALNHPFFHAA